MGRQTEEMLARLYNSGHPPTCQPVKPLAMFHDSTVVHTNSGVTKILVLAFSQFIVVAVLFVLTTVVPSTGPGARGGDRASNASPIPDNDSVTPIPLTYRPCNGDRIGS